MATHDYVIANGTGAAVRSDLNDALAAIVSNNSSSSEPATTYAYQWWADTTANVLKIRNSANNAWITLRELDGTMLIEDGSASAPGLSFASDKNTGIFRPSDNELAITSNGNERMSLSDSSVIINQDGDDVDFRVESDSVTHMLFVDGGNNNVGIGESSPDLRLHVSETINVAYSASNAVSDANNLLKLENPSTTANAFAGMAFRTGNGADLYFGSIQQSGNDGDFYFANQNSTNTELMRIKSTGDVGIGVDGPSFSNGSGLEIQRDGTACLRLDDNTNSKAGEIYADSSGLVLDARGTSAVTTFDIGGSEKMRLDNSGRLLIAASSSDANSAADDLQIGAPTDSGDRGITVASSAAGSIRFADNGNDSAGYIFYSHSDNSLRFGSNGSEAARIDSSGLVGIGTTSPGSYYAKQLVVDTGSASQSGITIVSDSSNQGMFAFADGTSGNDRYRGFLDYNHSNNSLAFGTNGSEVMRLTTSGKLRIGMNDATADPSASNSGLQLKNTSVGAITSSASVTTGSSHAVFLNPNGVVGTINTSGSGTSYNTSSDYRLKENVVDLNGAITRVKQLAPKRFNFIADADTTVDGFLAHEAQTVVPEAVTGTHNGIQVWQEGEELPDGVSVGDNKLDDDGNTIPDHQGIDQSKLVPLLTAALQEAIAKIETLETKVAALEAG